MSVVKPRVRNADVIPEVQGNLFALSPGSRFGLVCLGHGLRADPYYTAYLELRTQVYTVQTGMLTASELTYGLDIDDDDERSSAFLVVENRWPRPVAVACVRLIERSTTDNRPIPADELYGLDVGAGSVEVSRYIARLDDRHDQARVLTELLRSTIARIRHRGADDQVYAIVERPLERVLRVMGVGVRRVADPVWLDEYQGMNAAIQLDPIVSAASLGGLDEIDVLDVSPGSVRFWGEVTR